MPNLVMLLLTTSGLSTFAGIFTQIAKRFLPPDPHNFYLMLINFGVSIIGALIAVLLTQPVTPFNIVNGILFGLFIAAGSTFGYDTIKNTSDYFKKDPVKPAN